MSQKGSCPSSSPFMAGDTSTDIYRDILGLDIGFTNKAQSENENLPRLKIWRVRHRVLHGAGQDTINSMKSLRSDD